MIPRIGAKVFSCAAWYGDGLDQGSSTPKSGLVIDITETVDNETGECVDWVKVVQQWRGRIRYHSLRCDEIEFGQGDGEINAYFVRELIRALGEDMARNRSDHTAAIVALSSVQAVRS